MSRMICPYENEANCELLHDYQCKLLQTQKAGNVLYSNLELLRDALATTGEVFVNSEEMEEKE